jgi:hypothetical protein
MYFGILLGNHVAAMVLPLAYYPGIFTAVAAYGHLGCFCGLLINSICIEEKHPGKGGRTVTNRIFWTRTLPPTQSSASSTSSSSQPDSPASPPSSPELDSTLS